MRLSVNQMTDGRQTPWESSSLTTTFSFFGAPRNAAAKPAAGRTVEEWRAELQGKQPEAANELIVSDGSVEAYEAFVGLFAQPPFGPQARLWLDLHRRMVAWKNAVVANTAAAYHEFLVRYPDSDLTATARKLEARMRNRPASSAPRPAVRLARVRPPGRSLRHRPRPCLPPTWRWRRHVPAARRRRSPNRRRRSASRPSRRSGGRYRPQRRPRPEPDEEDIVVVRRAPPVYYAPGPSIGIGGYGRGNGGYGGSVAGSGRGRY